MQEDVGRRTFGFRLAPVLLFLLAGCGDPSRLFLHPVRELLGTPADWGFEYEDVEMPRPGGGATKGWWLPSAETDAAVVLFGGNSGNRSYFLRYAAIARQAGFSVLIVEYQGFGPDNGDVAARSLKLDGIAAMDWIRGKRRKIGVWGVSLGSAVAIASVAQRPGIADALCVEGSYELGPAFARYMSFVMPEIVAAPLSVVARVVFIGPGVDPASNLEERGGIPVFFIQGDRDRLTRTIWAAELFDGASGPKEMWLMPDTGHAPEPFRTQALEYAGQIARFFRRTLLGDADPQAVATWSARPEGDAWEIEAAVTCAGPFPAPVEVVAVAGDEVRRTRLWMTGPSARLQLETSERPAAVAARRYARVTPLGTTWRQEESAVARAYRVLAKLEREGLVENIDAIADLSLPPELAADQARLLLIAASELLLVADIMRDSLPDGPGLAPIVENKVRQAEEKYRALVLRAIRVAPRDSRLGFILGDAKYYDCADYLKEKVAADARRVYESHGWDASEIEEAVRGSRK